MSLHAALEPAYVVRAVRADDFVGFCALRELAGPGFTSLMVDDGKMRARIDHGARSFAADAHTPGKERYLLALEHIESGALAGSAGVKASIGDDPPFFNFRILKIAQASHVAERRFDMDVLILVNEFTGWSEVGSLFLRAEHRAGGIGRALAQARYMLMAAAPHRFHEHVVSELRGVVSPDGVSPFWEALGRHFFKMDFRDADQLSATTDNQFILDLMPKYPIYVDLLPAAARAVIGQCHVDGAGARRLLEWEGFRFENVVDIFDGGPLLSAARDSLRTRREARRLTLIADAAPSAPAPALIATLDVSAFRCTASLATAGEGEARVHPATLATLGLESGAAALVWTEHAA